MSRSEMDKVVEILRKTNDGNDLAPIHLALVEGMTRSAVWDVSEAMEASFEDLYAMVSDGRYDRNAIYLQGVTHLTKDHQGYVYWKGKEVEHFSFQDSAAERLAALELARICQSLESRKIPVTGRAVLDRRFRDAPEGTPWLQLLQSLYCAFFTNDERMWLLLATKEGKGIAIKKVGADVERVVFEDDLGMGSYNGFHALHQRGCYTAPERVETYAGLIHEVERAGFTPEDVRQAFALAV